jgi:putative acetyltransferase
VLRAYRDDDLADVLDVWYRASLIAHPFLSAEFLERERQQIADEWMPAADTTVYVAEGRVVGFLSLIGDEIGAIFVDPDRHRQGIGRALMDSALARRPFLELDVFEANETGRRFYEASGFEVVDRHLDAETGHPELRLRHEV